MAELRDTSHREKDRHAGAVTAFQPKWLRMVMVMVMMDIMYRRAMVVMMVVRMAMLPTMPMMVMMVVSMYLYIYMYIYVCAQFLWVCVAFDGTVLPVGNTGFEEHPPRGFT
jgi:hypothetical protein